MKLQCYSALTIVLTFLCLLSSDTVLAQIREVGIGVDGLTCSQCTRSVEMQLRRLKFVERVEMDLDSANGRISLRAGARVVPEAVAKAVSDAGFSIRYIQLVLNRPGAHRQSDSCILVDGLRFHSRASLPGDTVAAWKLILPVSQFKAKRAKLPAAGSCGTGSYEAVVMPLDE